jgi:hypothetical protein
MPAVSICGVGYCDGVARDYNKTALTRRMRDLLEKITCLQIICRHILYRVLSVIQRIVLIMCQNCKTNAIHIFSKTSCKKEVHA